MSHSHYTNLQWQRWQKPPTPHGSPEHGHRQPLEEPLSGPSRSTEPTSSRSQDQGASVHDDDCNSGSDSDEASFDFAARREVSSSTVFSNSGNNPELELATARLIWDLENSVVDELTLETGSVYGAAILLPQLARSAGWPKYLTVHAIRSYFFLLGNFLLQGWLIMSIGREQEIYDAFGGQMYLCDFKEGNMGPGGTIIDTPARLYSSFAQWNTRVFVRDALLSSFPELHDRIMETVDPGEYGMESSSCRAVCCLLFVIATLEEFYLAWHLARLIFMVPTRAESWMSLQDKSKGDSESQQAVRVRIAGIPLGWKTFYTLMVLTPKVLLWKKTMYTGFIYLMDTAEISNLIVNAVALGFILTIDEMVCSVFFTEDLKMIMQSCENYPLHCKRDEAEDEEEEEDKTSDDEVLRSFYQQRGLRAWRILDLCSIPPSRVVVAIILFTFFMIEYYHWNCEWSSAFRFEVSSTRFPPLSSTFSIWNFMMPFFFPLPRGDEPFWTMPAVNGSPAPAR